MQVIRKSINHGGESLCISKRAGSPYLRFRHETMNPVASYLLRSEKTLLGVCSTIAHNLKLQPGAVRITFIVLTLLFIPLGIFTYLGVYLAYNRKQSRMIRLSLTGTILGVPFSYYFQPEMVKHFSGSSIITYVASFTRMIEDYHQYYGNGRSIIYNVVISIIVFALIGGAVGYFLDRKQARKPK